MVIVADLDEATLIAVAEAIRASFAHQVIEREGGWSVVPLGSLGGGRVAATVLPRRMGTEEPRPWLLGRVIYAEEVGWW